MKPVTYLSLSLLFALLFVFSTTAMAGERKKPEGRAPKTNKDEKKKSDDKTQANGDVTVTRENDRVTSLKIGEQEVALDSMGKDLAALMDGKKTSATGALKGKALVLHSFAAEVTGTVKAANKDRKGEATAVRLMTEKGASYAVELDQQGKDLAKLDGKKVDVTGIITGKEGGKTLQVESVAEVAKKEPNEKEAKDTKEPKDTKEKEK